MAHEALAMVAPGTAGELAYLDRWVRQTGGAGSAGRARLRRGEARARTGQIQGAVYDLMMVVWLSPSPQLAAEAVVRLGRLQRLPAPVLHKFH